jgi:hypothetical protein
MDNDNLIIIRLKQFTSEVWRESVDTGWMLVKIMVPVLILTKILVELGVVDWIGEVFSPFMSLVGLPGSMGLVLAMGMIVSPYAALIIFASLLSDNPLTVAQSTVLGTMIMIAHALPVETSIAQKAGMRVSVHLVLRIGGAFLLGWILHQIYTLGNYLQNPSVFLWSTPPQDPSLWSWVLNEAKNLALIFMIIIGMFTLMKVLDILRITDLIKWLLQPILTTLGMSKEAAPITVIGITLGLALGGGLVIQEAKSGKMSNQEVFFSLALMCIFHSLIEDTIVMTLMGGHLSGLLWARIAFSLLVIFLMVKVVNMLPDMVFKRYLFREIG